MTFYKNKKSHHVYSYLNKFRTFPSVYRYPFWSIRWLWFTLCLDFNDIGAVCGGGVKVSDERGGDAS